MTTTSLSHPPLPLPPRFYPHPTNRTHFLTTHPPPLRPSAILSSSSSSSSNRDRNRDVWINPNKSKSKSKSTHHQSLTKTIGRRNNNDSTGTARYIDRSVDLPSLLSSLRQTTTPAELHAVMSQFIDSNNRKGVHLLSLRFMITLLSAEPDYRRTLALLDWMHSAASYPPSVIAYNVALRNSLRAHQFPLALGLLHEMRSPPLSLRPDPVTYSTLISALSRHPRLLDPALSLLHQISLDNIPIDLILYTNLIRLATTLNDHSKAISLFSALRSAQIIPDIIAYNSLLNVLARAGLFKEAHRLLDDMDTAGVPPDTISFSTLLAALVDSRKYLEALSLFADMRSRRIAADLTICNIMIDAYGQLDMAKEADSLFWSMRRIGIEPGVVTYNTMLRVYGDADLFGEAVHLFRLMQRKEIEQNVVTYNTMIRIYGKSLEHEKAGNLVQEMRRKGIEPNAVTYSTIISIWGKAGKLDRAAMLFQKLRSSGVEIDPVLYQTMIVVYERAGLVGHAKRLIHELRHPENNVSKGTAISVLAKAGRVEEAAWVFRQAVAAGEVKDVSVFRSMMELFSRNRRHKNVIQVFDALRGAGFYPDSEMIANVLNAYGKLQEFGKAEALYREMKDDGCIFTDRVHFQMMSLLGARQDFKGVESLLEELNQDPNIDNKELHLVAANVYERANRLDEAASIIAQISNRSSNSLALHTEASF